MIVTPSQFTKDEIVKYYGTREEKIVVIPNALGDDFLATSSDDNAVTRVRGKYHLPEEYLVYVGTLQPRKNIPFLMEVFASLKKRLPEVKLVLVGNRAGHHVDMRLETTLSRLNLAEDVIFPGFVDQNDLPAVIRGAKVFVFPSLYEGFGIPLLEAMSQEVPIAASDIPSLREVASDAAVYFDPATLASCEEKLYNLLIDQEQRMTLVRLGKDRLRIFSWKESASLLSQAYFRLSK